MDRRHTTLTHGLVTLLALSSCGGVCRGPQCASNWPEARLSRLAGPSIVDEVHVEEDADTVYDGSDTDGSGWVPVSLAEGAFVGMPDVSVAARLELDVDGHLMETLRLEGEPGTRFGAAVGVVELSGNDDPDLIVGAPANDFSKGRVTIFVDAGTPRARQFVLDGTTDGDRFGSEIRICPDLDGDGLTEVVVTAPWFAGTSGVEGLEEMPDLAGAVFVLDGATLAEAIRNLEPGQSNEGGAPWSYGRVFWGAERGEGAGHDVVCNSDHTGDGDPDLVIGAPWFEETRGRVFVLDGRAESGMLGTMGTTITGEFADAWFGMGLTTGEFDRSPPADVVVGAPGHDGGRGRAYIFAGGSLDARPIVHLNHDSSRDEADHFGRWLVRGDFDGNSLDDLIVGAPDYKEGRNGFDTGRAWLWSSVEFSRLSSTQFTVSLWTDQPTAQVIGDRPFQRVGRRPVVVPGPNRSPDGLYLPTRNGR